MKKVYRINGKRMEERLLALGEIGRTHDNGVHRMALSEEDLKAQELVKKWMTQAGMSVRRDHFGNLIGRREGKDPNQQVVMMGSHIDSVPNGGRFDGTVGVIGAIEVVQAFHDAGMETLHPIEVVAFCDEEGPRFSSGLFGSRGMAGKLEEEELHKKDAQGISRFEALQSFGLDPNRKEDSIRSKGDIKLYLEMHIEQGPYLESVDKAAGIVTGIAGPSWLGVALTGAAGHAGTVPMSLRKDPMTGAAEAILAINKICGSDLDVPTVGTIGKIEAYPGGSNVIPKSVCFSVDVRDIDLMRRERVMEQIRTALYDIATRRNLQLQIENHMNVPPVECSSAIISAMERANDALGLKAPKMVSGAGHDAMLLANITEIGMIFVRCREGISHSPLEWAEVDDIVKGTELMLETVLQFV